MKKIYSLVIVLLFLTTIYSQNNKAIYSVTINNKDEITKSPYNSYYKIAQENSNQFTFQLNFSKDRSEFFIMDNLEIEYHSYRMVRAFSRYQGFTSITKDKTFIEKEIDNETYILEEKAAYNWSLTTETKKIGNYNCYKATTEKTIENKIIVPITAWYCPEIAYQFGPNGYGNLPGLIVELQIDNVIYGLKSITFDDSSIKFKEIDFKKIISKEKYEEIIKEKMKFILDE
ncbi:GLPGLI family protein [Flavobacterium channae]|uniref:GLPGLI family protein n=1 Tax=Flavobacterium channae TaxID=2897181 RepID=UPI001E3B4DF3|nr:GLPGLI family protein [Flavobacterium channae]UGS23697.1 GLPGLI family protein [Flavobacterium channae]